MPLNFGVVTMQRIGLYSFNAAAWMAAYRMSLRSCYTLPHFIKVVPHFSAELELDWSEDWSDYLRLTDRGLNNRAIKYCGAVSQPRAVEADRESASSPNWKVTRRITRKPSNLANIRMKSISLCRVLPRIAAFSLVWVVSPGA